MVLQLIRILLRVSFEHDLAYIGLGALIYLYARAHCLFVWRNAFHYQRTTARLDACDLEHPILYATAQGILGRDQPYLAGTVRRVFFVIALLFAFFDCDTVDLYSRGIDIARVARRNGH